MKRLFANTQYKLPQLSNCVDSINFYHNPHLSDCKEILFDATPEGVFELVFQSNTDVWQKNSNEPSWRQRDVAFVGGLHQQSYQLRLPPDTEIVSVRFKPGAFKYIFNGALNQFANEKVPVVELWKSEGVRLNQRLWGCREHSEKIKLIADFVDSKIDQKRHSVIDKSVRQIISQNGLVSLSDLEHQCSLSSAQFRKRFREEVGLAPKKYTKIIRVNSILSAMDMQNAIKLIDLVYAHDFFDQSHFIKEFKSIIGKTPTQYFSAISA